MIYAVKDLQKAKKEWEDKGFVVEYGKPKNPFNALIYFSEGPFIELLKVQSASADIRFFIFLLKIFNKKGAYYRFSNIMKANEGWVDLSIECDHGGLEKEIEKIKPLGFKGTHLKYSSRKDTFGRDLRFQNFFPDDLNMPFLMSYYSIDPKPKNFIHPNGVAKISKIKIETTPTCKKTLNLVLDDDIIEIQEGNALKIIDVEF